MYAVEVSDHIMIAHSFKGVNTTTEWLTRWVFDQFAAAVKGGKLGREPKEISAIRVTVGESPNARAWYEAPLW